MPEKDDPAQQSWTQSRVAQTALLSLASTVITTGAVLGGFDRILGPSIREQSRTIARQVATDAMKAHLDAGPHNGAADKDDMAEIRRRLEEVATKESVEMLRREMGMLSERVKRLEEGR